MAMVALEDDGTTDTDDRPCSSSSLNTNYPPPPEACQVCGKEQQQGGDDGGNVNGELSDDEGDGGRERRRQPGRRFRLLRCTQCQNAWYCSVECQRIDWKERGHRRLCRRRSKKMKSNNKNNGTVVQEAQLELVRLLSSLSLDEATESYHKSMDEAKRMMMLKKDDQEAAAEANKKKNQNHRIASLQKMTTTTTTRAQKEPPKSIGVDTAAAAAAAAASSPSSSSPRPSRLFPPPCWDFFVEDLTRLSCYQIVILLQSDDNDHATTTPNDLLNITITLLAPAIAPLSSDEDEHASYVVRIAMQQQQQQQQQEQEQQERETENRNLMILQLALPTGSVILSTTNNMHDDDDNSQMTIPYTMDTTMNGRQRLASIRLRYTTRDRARLRQQHQSCQSPMMLPEPPLEVPAWSHSETSLLTVSEANRLACRACGHLLFDDASSSSSSSLQNNNDKKICIIQRVLPMASGRYEDMADYLMCYEGQAIVDFSSINKTTGSGGGGGGIRADDKNNVNMTLLQDETTLVLSNVVVDHAGGKVHDDDDFDKRTERDNIDDSHSPCLSFPSVCRMSIPGYGQVQTTSIAASCWRSSVGVGGNNNKPCLTLACNLCCSVLGEAQEEEDVMDEVPEQDEFSPRERCFTYRFWKHRLAVIPKEEDKEKKQQCRKKILSSTLAFMVQELIRLAETKAIYTLSIFCDKGMMEKGSGSSSKNKPQSPQVMVLRLVSWGDSSTCAAMAVMEADTAASASTHDTTASNDKDLESTIVVYPLKTWRPMAKVLFEIRNVSDRPDEMFPYPQPERQSAASSSSKNYSNDDNDVWSMLNQRDWCCPLPSSFEQQTRRQGQRNNAISEEEEKKVSNDNQDSSNEQTSEPPPVQQQQQRQRQHQVVLESGEWHQVLDALQQASRVYGKQVVSATFFAKTGREHVNNDNSGNNVTTEIGLAAVPL